MHYVSLPKEIAALDVILEGFAELSDLVFLNPEKEKNTFFEQIRRKHLKI